PMLYGALISLFVLDAAILLAQNFPSLLAPYDIERQEALSLAAPMTLWKPLRKRKLAETFQKFGLHLLFELHMRYDSYIGSLANKSVVGVLPTLTLHCCTGISGQKMVIIVCTSSKGEATRLPAVPRVELQIYRLRTGSLKTSRASHCCSKVFP